MESVHYSNQAEVMLKSMPSFDRQAFEIWFFEHLSIGSNNLLEYLIYLESIKPKIIKPILEVK